MDEPVRISGRKKKPTSSDTKAGTFEYTQYGPYGNLFWTCSKTLVSATFSSYR